MIDTPKMLGAEPTANLLAPRAMTNPALPDVGPPLPVTTGTDTVREPGCCTLPELTRSHQHLACVPPPTTELNASSNIRALDLVVPLFSNYLHDTSDPINTTYNDNSTQATTGDCHDMYTLASSSLHSSYPGHRATTTDQSLINNGTTYEYISPQSLLSNGLNSFERTTELASSANDLFTLGSGLQSALPRTNDAGRSPGSQNIPTPKTVSRKSELNNGSAPGSRKASRSRTHLIREWYLSHSPHPYASDEQIQDLALRTGLNVRQVRNCLSNLRARFRLQGQRSSSQGLFTVPTLNSGLHMTELDALETDVDHTIIAPSDFVADFNNTNLIPQPLSVPHNLFIDASSQTGSPSPFSSEEAVVSEYISPLQDLSTTVPEKRKGKRRYLSRHQADAEEESSFGTIDLSGFSTNVSKPFQCTVCTYSFKSAYEWQRHEVSVHKYHDTAWTCMLSGAILDDLGCAFCGEFLPDEEHLEQHNVSPCLQKDPKERQFFRKDGLKQHILRSHCPTNTLSATSTFVIPDNWAIDVEPNPLALWCGFCKTTLPSIADRMYHVTRHFKTGFTMDRWTARTEV